MLDSPLPLYSMCFFFFNDTSTTEIYTLSLHDALPIRSRPAAAPGRGWYAPPDHHYSPRPDRKSTRLNSSHSQTSYAVFCLKKKQKAGIASMPQRCASTCQRIKSDRPVRRRCCFYRARPPQTSTLSLHDALPI